MNKINKTANNSKKDGEYLTEDLAIFILLMKYNNRSPPHISFTKF